MDALPSWLEWWVLRLRRILLQTIKACVGEIADSNCPRLQQGVLDGNEVAVPRAVVRQEDSDMRY